jgi:hypothetical protein
MNDSIWLLIIGGILAIATLAAGILCWEWITSTRAPGKIEQLRALAEYQRVRMAAQIKYERAMAPIIAEFDRRAGPELAAYGRAQAAAWEAYIQQDVYDR